MVEEAPVRILYINDVDIVLLSEVKGYIEKYFHASLMTAYTNAEALRHLDRNWDAIFYDLGMDDGGYRMCRRIRDMHPNAVFIGMSLASDSHDCDYVDDVKDTADIEDFLSSSQSPWSEFESALAKHGLELKRRKTPKGKKNR